MNATGVVPSSGTIGMSDVFGLDISPFRGRQALHRTYCAPTNLICAGIMRLQMLFPRWRALSALGRPLWRQDVDLGNDKAFETIVQLLLHEQNPAQKRGLLHLSALSIAICEDIVDLADQKLAGVCDLNLHYLQFEASVLPLIQSLAHGDFGLAHNWILNGFCKEISANPERRFEIVRAQQFFETTSRWIQQSRVSSFYEWFTRFYYYCRIRSAVHHIAGALLPFAVEVARQAPQERTFNLLRFVINWAASIDHPFAARSEVLGVVDHAVPVDVDHVLFALRALTEFLLAASAALSGSLRSRTISVL